jgi:homoserine kinase type II
MGIKTKLTLQTINNLTNLKFDGLQQTKDGISDTTYIISRDGQNYICKLYENSTFDDVKQEQNLLTSLQTLKVPKPLWKIYTHDSKPLAFYSFISGLSLTFISREHLKEIGEFLGSFHQISQNLTTTQKLYTHKNFTNLPKEFQTRYELIKDIKLYEDGVIHGDLFPDNAKFIDGELSGVFDFVEASLGDFCFDLAVVANSWCFEDVDILLESYNQSAPKKIEKKRLVEMMKFTALFYALQRFHGGVKEYHEYLEKFDALL